MKNVSGISVNPKPEGYSEDQQEAAITLNAFREVLTADNQKVAYADPESGNEFTEQDKLASILAARINETPYYQDRFNIGGGSGRKVVGFTSLVNDENRASLPPETLEALPQDAFVPIIENAHTGTTGPATKNASAEKDDEVQYITLSNLEKMAGQ